MYTFFLIILFLQVVEGLLKKNEPGAVPHYTVPHTFGSLASVNTFGIIPYLKRILGLMIPLLGGIKQDTTRQAFAYGKTRKRNNLKSLTYIECFKIMS